MTLSTKSFARAICVVLLILPAVQVNAANPFHGTWELNLAKSKFDPGPPPKSQTRTFGVADEMETSSIEGVNPKGETMSSRSTYRLDGKDYPVIGSRDVDSLSMTAVDARTVRGAIKREGKLVANVERKVSADGKTMTITAKGINREGQPTNNVLVFERKL